MRRIKNIKSINIGETYYVEYKDLGTVYIGIENIRGHTPVHHPYYNMESKTIRKISGKMNHPFSDDKINWWCFDKAKVYKLSEKDRKEILVELL